MTKAIAISGKGGVGKTTTAALLVKYLVARKKVVLAVDADPNSTLDIKLGVRAETSIGALREEIMKSIDDIPSGMSKSEWLDLKMRLAITEGRNFDLLTVGRPEGPGCYCYVNQVLRTLLDKISERYDFVVVDCEAGMEHLSRRTTRDMDTLLIVSDSTREGILTAGRIKALAKEMALKVKDVELVVNLMRGMELTDYLKGLVSEVGFERGIAALIPYDENIERCSQENSPVIGIPESSKAYRAIEGLAKKLFG